MLLCAGPSASDVYISMVPAAQTVLAGQEFDVELWVPQAGSEFNAISATVGYDTTLLASVAMPRAFQEGPLLPSGCGNAFYTTRTDTSRVNVISSLLCNQVSLTGPGLAFRLRFRVKNVPSQITALAFIPYACCWGSGDAYTDETAFYNAGFYVTPIHMENAIVTILGPAGVASVGRAVSAPDGVYDVQGRRVEAAGGRSGVTFTRQRKRTEVR